MQYTGTYMSPLGGITLASDGNSLTGLWFDGQKYFGSTLEKERRNVNDTGRDLPVFEQARKWLDIYFQGVNPDFIPPLAPKGSVFRRDVWKLLMEIPYGETVTYGEISERIAEKRGLKTMSAQAVGGAVGHNPVSIIIPCHRVLGRDGKLTGYAGGLDKKKYLLELERKEKLVTR